MQEITLKLSINEANLILEGLGELPFKKVYDLVSKIQQQASTQLGSNGQAIEEEVEAVIETQKKAAK